MGIPFYFRVVTQAHPDILTTNRPVCDAYYVDFNGMIHQAAQRVIRSQSAPSSLEEIETRICEETWNYLQECVKYVSPRKSVHICVDGVAPIAKMAQQRKRRFLSHKRLSLLPREQQPVWDTNAITPGTAFMTKLQDYLKVRICEETTLTYELSAADECGEGEHKIFSSLASSYAENALYCIHGLDADLIMLSLMSHIPNISLVREGTATGASVSDFVILDIDKLRIGLLRYIQKAWTIEADAHETDIIESYLVLCFFLGNDFLPHMPGLSLKKDGYTKLLDVSASVIPRHGLLVSNGTVNMEVLLHITKELQNKETEVMLEVNNEYMMRAGYGTSPSGDADTWPMWKGNKDIVLAQAIANAGPNKWRTVYYKHCFNTKMNDTNVIVMACKQFLTGILWTYAYYTRRPKDDKWLYRYGYAPTMLDIANTLCVNMEYFSKLSGQWAKRNSMVYTVHPDVQLLCVLPPSSIPYHLKKFATCPEFGIAHLFPCSYPIKTYLHSKLWECSPVLPQIDVELVEEVISKYLKI